MGRKRLIKLLTVFAAEQFTTESIVDLLFFGEMANHFIIRPVAKKLATIDHGSSLSNQSTWTRTNL